MTLTQRALRIHLYGQTAAFLVEQAQSSWLVRFDPAWAEDPERPVLTLRARDWNLRKPRRFERQLPPFLSNLLFERGEMRERVARQYGLDTDDAFGLLLALGQDLSGAIRLDAVDGDTLTDLMDPGPEPAQEAPRAGVGVSDGRVHWSLGGMQPKWSADFTERRTLTVTDEAGGRWILKVPTPAYPQLARAELAAMEWARSLGFEVPRLQVMSTADVEGLPPSLRTQAVEALLVRRFDRLEDRSPVHMEELASVLGLQPGEKYHDPDGVYQTNLVQVCRVFRRLGGDAAFQICFRRILLDLMVGNGDAHLKNWAFLFPDRRTPRIAPAYDVVPTVLYPPFSERDELALPFTSAERGDNSPASTLRCRAVTVDRVREFAAKLSWPREDLVGLAQQTVRNAAATFPDVMIASGLADASIRLLERRWRDLPLVRALL